MCLRSRRGLNCNSVRAPIPSDTLKGITPTITMSEQTQVVQSTTTAPISEALFTQLRATSILSSLRDDEIRCLGGFEEVRLKRGDVLARQGETAHYFWILLEGQLSLTQTMPDGREMEVTSIPAGNSFGEVPLLNNIPKAVNL